MSPISTALSARAVARQCHQQDVEALALARDRLATSQAELERLAAEDRAAVDRLAKRLAQQARAGNAGPVPTPMPTDKHTAAFHAARITVAAATAVVADIESAHRQSRQALANAESDAHAAAIAVLTQEGDDLAADIAGLLLQVEAKRTQLLGLRGLNVTPTAAVRRVVTAPGDWVNVPMNELRAGVTAGGPESALHVPRDKQAGFEIPVTAVDHWQRRLDALLHGEIEPTPAEQAA